MPSNTSPNLSSNLGEADAVEIRLGDDVVKNASHYDIHQSIYDQPASFSLTIGDGNTAASIIKRYPPNTPFQLLIGGQAQFTGYTDGYEVNAASGSNAAEITIHGRDIMAQLHDWWIDKEQDFNAKTILEMVQKALDDVTLTKPFEAKGTRPLILSSNADNRRVISGSNVVAQDDTSDKALIEIAGSRGNRFSCVRTAPGERMLDLLRRELDAVGLFPWATGTGDIVIGRPNAHQDAIYRILRTRAQFDDGAYQHATLGNASSAKLRVDVKDRYSDIAIYGRTSGHKKARSTAKGAFTDDEMVSLGYNKVLVVRDAHATTLRQCEHVAALKIADGRRKGLTLEYTVSGHSTMGLDHQPHVWAVDTVVDVIDDEFGLLGPYYIETVHHMSKPQAQTSITLIDPIAVTAAEETSKA